MRKPTLYNISAFSCENDAIIKFAWTGNQSFSNTVIIRENDSNNIVYNETQETMQLYHTIPANSLLNGVLYNVQVKITDRNNTSSEFSDPVLFYCFSKPIFTLNIENNQIINNSSYLAQLTYSQLENEELQSYQFNLFDKNKNPIYSSGIKYNTSTLAYNFTGLEDSTTYYVKATGITLNGMELDTGYILFHVNYVTPSMYSLINLTNRYEYGDILIRSNMISLEGVYISDSNNPIYIDNNFIDLTNPSNKVKFEDGLIMSDYILNLSGYNLSLNTIILSIDSEVSNVTVKTIPLYEGYFLELTAKNKKLKYITYSDSINPSDGQKISVWIKNKNGKFDIYAQIESGD